MKGIENDDEMILVCIRADEPSPWKATNLLGVCRFCGVAVQYRPHAPNVPKVCVPCFRARTDPEKDEYMATRQSIAEVDAERRKN